MRPAGKGAAATVTASFANSCGDSLQGASIDFAVTSGPDAGTTGTATTDASGNASFTYVGAASGTDTVIASTSNPAGTITSNSVTVTWYQNISASGGQKFAGTEPAAVSGPAPVSGQSFNGPVADFTDANAATSSTADFTVTINWGDGSPASAGTVTGNGGSYAVSGTHTYAGTGFFTVKVHIVDDGGSTADATTRVLIYGTTHGGSFVIGNGDAACTRRRWRRPKATTARWRRSGEPAPRGPGHRPAAARPVGRPVRDQRRRHRLGGAVPARSREHQALPGDPAS